MNKAVIYISGTTNETVNNMIVEVLERYCEKHEYEIVALLGENSQAGMSMPMKYSFIGMAEVETCTFFRWGQLLKVWVYL